MCWQALYALSLFPKAKPEGQQPDYSSTFKARGHAIELATQIDLE